MKKTKIIATLGPATLSKEKIAQLLKAGMNVVRINMSHKVESELLQDAINWIRMEAQNLNISVAILFDLGGPKIRVGNLQGIPSINIVKGNKYSIGYEGCDIPLNIPLSFTHKTQNGLVKVDDGNLSFQIITSGDKELTLISQSSGTILPGKGVNFPGIKLNLPSVTEKDLKDLELAVKLGADWLAMSFVRSANDQSLIRKALEKYNIKIPVIAKIEKPEAIEDLDEIISTFDGILVARGGLGVEMPLRELPILQKKIVNGCLQKHKPVIIATQMLETMIQSPNPTRAEVNDIANAIYDGADAVMLSGETAIGKYPVESVQIMSEIADSVERDMDWKNFNRYINQETGRINDKRSSICHAAMTLSNDLSIQTIVIMTESGQTAIKMAQYRPKAHIYALCSHRLVFQMLSLIWGITPVLVDSFQSTDEMIQSSGKILKDNKYLETGDQYIITAGAPVGVTGTTNMLKIHNA